MYTLNNRYRIVQKRADGGMAAVYEAVDLFVPGARWAVKEMSDAQITDPLERQQAITAFQQEAQMLRLLSHPNLPKVVDSFSQGGKEYLVMEYVDGQTLEELFHNQGSRPLPENQVVAWALALCDVLGYLHRQNIIFRDLKPANIMVDRGGALKLIDFGIVRFFKPGKKSDTRHMGTPGYAAPEQYGGGQTDARSDIYSLAATTHHLLSGVDPSLKPFHFDPLRTHNPAVTTELERVLSRALQTNQDQRWQSTDALRTALLATPTAKMGRTPSAIGPVTTPSKTGGPKPITTRLLLAMSEMSNEQLAAVIGGVVIGFAVLTAALGPLIQNELGWLWRAFPLYFAAAPAVWCASQRRYAAGITHALVGVLVASISAGLRPDWIIGALVGAAVIEGGIALGQYKRSDAAWLIGVTLAGWLAQTLVVYGVAVDVTRSAALILSGVAGFLGWFVGDFFWQARKMRQGQAP